MLLILRGYIYRYLTQWHSWKHWDKGSLYTTLIFLDFMTKHPATPSKVITNMHIIHHSNLQEQIISLLVRAFSGVRNSIALIFMCICCIAKPVIKVFNLVCFTYYICNNKKKNYS